MQSAARSTNTVAWRYAPQTTRLCGAARAISSSVRSHDTNLFRNHRSHERIRSNCSCHGKKVEQPLSAFLVLLWRFSVAVFMFGRGNCEMIRRRKGWWQSSSFRTRNYEKSRKMLQVVRFSAYTLLHVRDQRISEIVVRHRHHSMRNHRGFGLFPFCGERRRWPLIRQRTDWQECRAIYSVLSS